MASSPITVLLFLGFFLLNPISSALAQGSGSPAPSPHSPTDNSTPPTSPDSSANSSPPAPPPPDLTPPSPVPSPAPAPGRGVDKSANPPLPDFNRSNTTNADNPGKKEAESSGGMSGGQKAGVAVGVIAGVAIIGIGAMVYKKRQQNLQRSEYGYAARREFL